MDGNKISVVIADDNKEFCSILNDYLLNQKDIVVTGIAKDGREALTLIEEKQPDLVVLDIIMPHQMVQEYQKDLNSNEFN